MTPSPYPAPFTSAHFRARMVKILLIVGAVVTGISIVAESLSFVFPPLTEDQDVGDNPMGLVVMLITFLIAVLELIVYVTTVVFFLMWLYRVYNNLRAINPSSRLDSSAGFAVGSFFIPFANLIFPYRAVREAWQKSGPPDEAIFSAPSPPAYFPIWWVFWLLASFAGNISIRVTFEEGISESTATMISIVAGVLSIIAAGFAYMVVNAIDKRQEDTSRKVNLGSSTPGPPPPPTNFSMPDVVAPAS